MEEVGLENLLLKFKEIFINWNLWRTDVSLVIHLRMVVRFFMFG